MCWKHKGAQNEREKTQQWTKKPTNLKQLQHFSCTFFSLSIQFYNVQLKSCQSWLLLKLIGGKNTFSPFLCSSVISQSCQKCARSTWDCLNVTICTFECAFLKLNYLNFKLINVFCTIFTLTAALTSNKTRTWKTPGAFFFQFFSTQLCLIFNPHR